MNEHELHASSGRVSSMPGSLHYLPAGTMCDQHEDRPAVKRVQGETDSFGCEYVCMCQECYDAYRKYRDEEYEAEQFCEQCSQMKQHCRQVRDPDEGQAGRLYTVCEDCRIKNAERATEEYEEYRWADDDFDYDMSDADGDYDEPEEPEPAPYVPMTDEEWHKVRAQNRSKFSTHHLPVGTVVELDRDSFRACVSTEDKLTETGIRTVLGLSRNGANSYVFTTGLIRIHGEIGDPEREPFAHDEQINISYIRRIIRRGTGPVKIEYEQDRWLNMIKEDLERSKITKLDDWKPRRGNYNVYDVRQMLLHELYKFAPTSGLYQTDLMIMAVVQQSWCKRIQKSLWFSFYEVNRKRLRRWLRQNHNRFLQTVDKAERAETDYSNETAERECRRWDKDFDAAERVAERVRQLMKATRKTDHDGSISSKGTS